MNHLRVVFFHAHGAQDVVNADEVARHTARARFLVVGRKINGVKAGAICSSVLSSERTVRLRPHFNHRLH